MAVKTDTFASSNVAGFLNREERSHRTGSEAVSGSRSERMHRASDVSLLMVFERLRNSFES
jgi:hypothetical protein